MTPQQQNLLAIVGLVTCWGAVLLAHGHVVVSDVRLESVQELRTFLDGAVEEANRIAVETRARLEEERQAEEAACRVEPIPC